jgi:mono/diheme cytochrome c family protein
MSGKGRSMSMYLLRCAVVLMAVGAMGSGLTAPPIVPGFERFGRGAVDEAAAIESGLVLLGELGCVNCHAVGKERATHLQPKRGPVLDRVGERVKPEWLIEYLKQPQAVKPGTTMPHALAGLPDTERERTATAIAHFLSATCSFDDASPAEADKANAAEGLKIYERAGCAVCHGSLAKNAVRLPDQMPLVDLDKKWSPRALDEFLKNPFHIRPSSRMPALPLKDNERRHLVASLLRSLPPPRNEQRDHVAFNGRAWHLAVTKLPAVESLGPPATTGPVRGFDVVKLAERRDNFVVQLDGFLHAPTAGTYHFYLSSDDGSRLLVGGRQIVENDGIHADTERHGEIVLEAGVHPIRVDSFEASGNQSLHLDVTPPHRPRRSAVEYVTPAAADTPLASMAVEDSDPSFKVEPALVAEGRAAFAAVGCAGCHDLNGSDGTRIESVSKPKQLADLAAIDAGCLAMVTRQGTPHYTLDGAQRTAVAAAIGWLRSPAAESAPARERTIDRMLTALNCYACHNRDGRGGTIPAVAATDEDGEPILKDAARDAMFTSGVQEMGDEGRLPPTLTGVGDKLTSGFLREVLVEGGKDRGAYMHTLMPKWHAAVVEPLGTLLAEDPKTTVATPSLAGHAESEIEEQGRGLVGSKSLGCIKCHSFGGDKGQSLGVIDMTRMPRRLRHDWFLAYVANPQQFRPGTRMPASWPEGKTFYPDVLDGTVAGQIEGVWRYLGGTKPRPPVGSGTNPIELVPVDRPIIYRNFIEGAGPRAIGVGYPEKLNLAWDADRLRLALVWRGAFIDAGKHWTGRGQGFQPPLGDRVFTPDIATPLARFEDATALANAPWPKGSARDADGPADGHRFSGYSLDAYGRPTMLWRWGDMRVQERFTPAEFTDEAPPTDGKQADGKRIGLRRTVTVAGPSPAPIAAWRLAIGKDIEAVDGGWYVVDHAWRVRLNGTGNGTIVRRETDGLVELRVPLVWTPTATAEQAVIEEELAW